MLELKNTQLSSEIWRIKIPHLSVRKDSSDEEDDEYEDEEVEFKIHPKLLVGCLRIDSYFASNMIPSIDVFLDIARVELNVLNDLKRDGHKPDIMVNYQLNDDRELRHVFLKNQLNSLKMYAQIFDENCMNLELDSSLSISIIDYSCSNFIPLVDSFHWKVMVDLNNEEINVNLLTDSIKIKYGPSIGHALMTSKKIWEQNLSLAEPTIVNNELVIHTRFIVCNNTVFPISFNQFKTNEEIYLLPKAFCLYSFRTDKIDQQLQLSTCQKNVWSRKSDAIFVNRDTIEYVLLDDGQYLILTVKSISSTQKKISINGQIEVYNMCKEVFRLQYKFYDKSIENAEKCEINEFDLGGRCSGSIYGKCLSNSQQSMRLKIAKDDKKGWSGEIPLREIINNNKPWMVKVPSITKGGHTSFWVRIIRETVKLSDSEHVGRVLVIIWPLFMLKSLLTVHTTVGSTLK